MLYFFGIVFLIAVLGLLFLRSKEFGALPTGSRLSRVLRSPNFREGAFQNLTPTEMILKGASYPKMIRDMFRKPANLRPPKPLPSVKTNLKSLPHQNPTVVWFGHSSYLISSQGFIILIDPVLQGHASPLPIFGEPFAGSDVYGLADLPKVDLVLLTHDHYDHLQYKSIAKLAGSDAVFCASLGVGAHLERWGVPNERITELDWWESHAVVSGVKLTAVPARHFSGRKFKRGQSLWSAFVLTLHGHQLFLGGDSGYEKHFAEIGARFGPFDLAILECGQYGTNWPYIHMLPEQTAQAAKDLQAKVLMPVHWAKFQLAFHPWDDSIKRVTAAAALQHQPITTPQIGEPVVINETYPGKRWWEAW